MFSPLEQFDAIIIISFFFFNYDFSFINIVLPLLLLNFFVFFLYLLFKKNMKLIPEIWQYFFESLYNFVFGLIKQQIGPRGYIYFPFIFTLFTFILFCNLLSLTPFSVALTSHIIMICFLTFTLISSIFVIGLYTHNIHFLKIFIPEAPFSLLFLLIPIEIFSYVIRAFSLAIRLSANIMAVHTLVYIISSFLIKMTFLKFVFLFVFIGLLLAILLLEIGVAFLQAYVFTILVCIYLSDSLKSPGH